MKSVERLLPIPRGAVLNPAKLANNSTQNKEQSWCYSTHFSTTLESRLC